MNIEESIAQMQLCPVCKFNQQTILERIDITEQHKLYAPKNPSVQKILSEIVQQDVPAYSMALCASCGLEYANPMTAPSSAWYDSVYKLLPLYPAERWEYGYVLSRIKKGETVGDIGCGSGDFLIKCQQHDVSCYGVDFSVSAIEQCHVRNVFAAVMDTSKDFLGADGPKDTLVAFHVLEHLDNPGQLFEWANVWSKTGSAFWVAIPSNLRPSRVLQEKDFLDQPPHHMTRWTRNALDKIGSDYGWKLVEHRYEPISVMTCLWWYSTRSRLYKKLFDDSRKSKWIEKSGRSMMYPFAVVQWLFAKEKMTGFSQLAKYERINER